MSARDRSGDSGDGENFDITCGAGLEFIRLRRDATGARAAFVSFHENKAFSHPEPIVDSINVPRQVNSPS
jgi:hypothetical protein